MCKLGKKTSVNVGWKSSRPGCLLGGHFTSSSLWFLMPRTKSWRFLSNIRSMLPLTIFKAMSVWLGPLPSCWTRRFPEVPNDRPDCLSSTRDRVGRSDCCVASPGRRSWGQTGRPVLCCAARRGWWSGEGNGWQNGVESQLTPAF